MTHHLDEEQVTIFQTLYDIVVLTDDNQRNMMTTFFIDGKPGWGKTFVADALATRLRSEGHIILIVVTSALAATLCERGRTAHSLFRIPVKEVSIKFISLHNSTKKNVLDKDNIDLQSSIQAHTYRAELILEASLIIC